MLRTQLINAIIQKNHYTSYLEIGIGTGRNFKFIKCLDKVSVDPDKTTQANHYLTSDQYFAVAGGTFDCIFIDGLHHEDQAEKDLINSWNMLSFGGIIIMHDTNPLTEFITHVPRDNKEWCGDVYKLVSRIKNNKFTLTDDHGLTIIKKEGDLELSEQGPTWQEFDVNRKELLNLKTWAESLELI